MRQLIGRLWNSIPPGVAIAMLTLPAFILPFIWERLTPLLKGAGISVVVLLVAIEISVIYRERGRQNQTLIAQMERLEQLRRLQDSHLVALNRVLLTVNRDGLRSRAMNLSAAILEFIYRRLENEPQFSTQGFLRRALFKPGEDWLKKMQESQAYHFSTNREYFERFRDRTSDIYNEIVGMGISDDGLASALNDASVSDHTIQFIGQTIGDLAERLRD
jgi:hypothetical protein